MSSDGCLPLVISKLNGHRCQYASLCLSYVLAPRTLLDSRSTRSHRGAVGRPIGCQTALGSQIDPLFMQLKSRNHDFNVYRRRQCSATSPGRRSRRTTHGGLCTRCACSLRVWGIGSSRHGRQKWNVGTTYRIRDIEVSRLRDRAEVTRCATCLSAAAPARSR